MTNQENARPASQKIYPPIERVWLLLSNICPKGKFKVDLELNGIAEEKFCSYVEQEEGVISEHHNLTWIIEKSKRVQDLEAQLKEAVEALEYYAHPDHYEEVMRISGLRPPGVLVDKGGGAREALAKIYTCRNVSSF